MTVRFLTYFVKPWDELNLLLAQRFAFQPDVSDVTRLADALAIAIKHQSEVAGVCRSAVDAASIENRLMSDVADAAKHGKLRNPSRDNSLQIGALFECSPDNKFRFLRNVVTIHHASFGERDFISTAREAILYWVQALNFPINWNPFIAEGPMEFFDEAFLYFNPNYQVSMSATNLRFVRRTDNGNLEPYDPPQVKFAVYKYVESST